MTTETKAVGVRLPVPMVRELDAIARERQTSRTALIEGALEQWLRAHETSGPARGGGAEPEDGGLDGRELGEGLTQLAASSVRLKRKTGTYPNHQRLLELYQSIKGGEEDPADPDRMADKIALTEAILIEAVERMSRQAEALEAWYIEGYGKPPIALLDPVALMPVLNTYRQLVQAVYQNRLTDAMTRGEVVKILAHYGSVIRTALEGMRADLEGSGVDAEALFERILDRIDAGGRELLGS